VLTERYRLTPPMHPVLAEVLRDGKAQQVSDPYPGLLLPLIARGRTLGVVSLFVYDSGRRFDHDARGLADDLSGRIALAVDNARLYHAAADAHRRFQDLVEGVGAIVWEADAVRRHYTFVSGRAITLLGYPLGRWYDEADFWLKVQHPADRERSAAEGRAARTEMADHDLEYRVLTTDGGIVWVLDLVRVVRHPDGTVSHLRGVMVDISESKRAELALREGEEARRQAVALASVAALASAAAHEINNPLAIIQGNLEMFARSVEVSSALDSRLDPMLDAVRRITAIVGSMRRITRLESVPMPDDLPEMLDLRRCGGVADDS
jgi:PAS domain S-box-containing protein